MYPASAAGAQRCRRARTIIQQRYASARSRRCPSSDAERPAKRRRGDEVDARAIQPPPMRAPGSPGALMKPAAVHGRPALDAREARSHGRQLRAKRLLRPSDLGERRPRRLDPAATLPRAQLLPELEEFDFFHNADSEPPIPLSGDLEPLRRCSLASRPRRRASRRAPRVPPGEREPCIRQRRTRSSATTRTARRFPSSSTSRLAARDRGA